MGSVFFPILSGIVIQKSWMAFWATVLSRAKGPQQASPGQARNERRPGYCNQRRPSPEGARQIVQPFQGFVPFARFPQGVALGWLVTGLWPGTPLLSREIGSKMSESAK
jgi:hypothetical protein